MMKPHFLTIAAGIGLLAFVSCRNTGPKDTIFTRCPDQIENIYIGCDYMRNTSSDAGVYDTYGAKNFALMMFSDIHEDRVRTANAIELLDGCKAIDAGIFLGDFQYWRYEEGWANEFAALTSAATKPLLLTVGNHDARTLSTTVNGTNPSVLVDNYMMKSDLAAIYTKGGYGLYDFADYGVRIIILNDFEYPEENNPGEKWVISGSRKVMTQTQINWFIDALKAAPEGYSIIVAQHLCEPMEIDLEACSPHGECPNVKTSTSPVRGDIGLNGGPVVSDIIDAFMRRAEIHNTYTSGVPSCFDPDSADFPDPLLYPAELRADADFTSSKAEFVCTIAGHFHNTLVGHNAKYPTQVVYVNDAASCPRIVNDGTSVSQYSPLPRNAEGPSQDLITVLCLDKVNRRLNFVRVGAHIDLLLEDHSLLSYPY